MKYLEIDGTGIRVSRLAFGTASLHRVFSAASRQRLLHEAVLVGITHFDTSPFYGEGLAERDLAKLLRGRRSEITVATKVGLYPNSTASASTTSVWARKVAGKVVPSISRPVIDWTVERAKLSLRESLARLRCDYVDFLFLHEPDRQAVDADEFMRWIEAEHASGTVRCWGLAGEASLVAPWLRLKHPLARVIQTRDSIERQEADFIGAVGRRPQFTYGYLSSGREDLQWKEPSTVMRAALARNERGAVIVSTRRGERISQLAGVVQ